MIVATKVVALTLGLSVFAWLMLFGPLSQPVYAQVPDPEEGSIIFFKECVDGDDEDVDNDETFEFEFDVQLDDEFDEEDEDFDIPFDIECGQEVMFDEDELEELLEFLDLENIDDAIAVISETDTPDDVDVEFSGDCSDEGEIDLDDEDIDDGLVCVITNVFGEDGGDDENGDGEATLTVEKECVGGTGSFPIIIRQGGAAGSIVAANVLGCNGSISVEVDAGDVTIQELVAVTNFVTTINCGNGSSSGTSRTIDIDEGDDIECTVRNVFSAAPTNNNGIIINNNNLNDNNVNNTNNLVNQNENANTNTNENSQEQENNQTQNNNNNQATNVDSSPNVNISGAGPRPVRPASVPPTVVVAPPSTGSGGLAGIAERESKDPGPLTGLLIVAAATLAMTPLAIRLYNAKS